MKKLLFLLLVVLIAFPSTAGDFSYTFEGQTVKYTVTDESAKTVAVAEGNTGISGDLTLPVNPKYGDVAYTLTTIGEKAFYWCQSLTSVTIPNSVTTIGEKAFYWCQSLTSVTIPNSVTTIGDYAFYACSHLTSVTIPNSVTTIGEKAFNQCFSLTSVTIPNSVTTIGEEAFSACYSLTSVTIANSVTTIGERAFDGCSSLTSIDVNLENPSYSSADGVLFNKDYSLLVRCPGGKAGDYIIPNSVTTIGEGAFRSCYSLTSVTIPNSVTTIGEGAFSVCNHLTSITIPNSVTTIGDGAFSRCYSLTSIDVNLENPSYSSADGVLFDKDYSLLVQCPGGKAGDYIIPNSVTTIGDWAFSECDSLTSVTFPNSVTTIGERAFNQCYSLTSVALPNSVTTIGDYAFYYCWRLTSVTLPNSVTTIGKYAFGRCGLTSVTIPNSVTRIGRYAFSECSRLASVYYNTTDPIVSGINIFDGNTYSDATLYVPASAVGTFRQTEPWSNFRNIQGYDFTSGVEDVTAGLDETQPCEYFNLSGVKAGNIREDLAPGIYIMRQGNASRKIVVK